MASRPVFERNLAAIRRRHPGLADALAAASTEDVEEEVGPRGATILTQAGVRLGSAYDPVREGRQIAASMAAEPADIMVAVGMGLGEQFAPYLETNPGTLIIYEPSIARLRAALERISIVNLFGAHQDLFLVTDLDAFRHIFGHRYAPGLRVRVFPHPALLRLDRSAVAAVIEATRYTKEVVDTQRLTSIEMLMPWALMTAKNGRRIAERPQIGALADAFAGKPAVVVAAGPSLDKQLPLLREIQDRVVVIAIGQTTRALRQAGIEPHLVHLLESRDVSHQLEEAGDCSDLIVAPAADSHPAVFDVPTRAQFTVTAVGGQMGVWIAEAMGETQFTMGGGTVAQGAVGIGVLMGCNPIALIGQDLAFTDGKVYASNSAYDFVEVDLSNAEDCRFSNMSRKADLLGHEAAKVPEGKSRGRRVVWVDGWNEGEKVPTWRAYASFLDQYREIGIGLRMRGWQLINCTEGGARIPELEHRSFRAFAEEFATAPVAARETLLEAHDTHRARGLEDFREAIASTEKSLDRVEAEAKKGRRFARRTRDRLLQAKSDQQRVEILRGLARYEKRVRRQLERIPWLDALVQPEIYNAIAAVRRTERFDPTDEDLADESGFLFEAAINGTERARVWLEVFAESFATDATTAEAGAKTSPAAEAPGVEAASPGAEPGRAQPASPAGYVTPPG